MVCASGSELWVSSTSRNLIWDVYEVFSLEYGFAGGRHSELQLVFDLIAMRGREFFCENVCES